MLTDTTCKNAKPKDKPYKLADEKGLYLLVNPNGSKYFRLKYRVSGKEKLLSLGVYPETSLKQARDKRNEARGQIANGIDPSSEKKKAKQQASNSFESIAIHWLQSISHTVKTQTFDKKQRSLELHVYPAIGLMPIGAIKSTDIFALIKPIIERKENETAHRIQGLITNIFAYAIAHGLTEYDPAQAVRKQLPAIKVKHRSAIIDPNLFAQLLRDISGYQGTFIVQSAFKLSPLLFQRPGEIRKMRWADVDLVAKEWRPYVTKTDFHHIVPLSKQALIILGEIKPVTDRGAFVFPSIRGDGRPMSDNTIRTALRTLGYDSETMTPNGFRTTASTLLNEQGWSPDAIERQLSHAPRDAVRAAYNRAQYLEERRQMMQTWADYLDKLKTSA